MIAFGKYKVETSIVLKRKMLNERMTTLFVAKDRLTIVVLYSAEKKNIITNYVQSKF